MKQYVQQPFWNQLSQERKKAHTPVIKLTAKGRLPSKQVDSSVANHKALPAKKANLAQADKDYSQMCASCHGLDGKGDTPMAQALNPRPRDFSDSAWQKEKSDEHIAKVIREGGTSVGLSPLMAPWGGMLDKERITSLVVKIRAFKK